MSARPTRAGAPRPLGLTVVFCAGTACSPSNLQIRERLREVIRHCEHGVLIAAPCLLGALGCPAGHGAGVRGGGLLLVQPCRPLDRRPDGPAVLVGPVESDLDLDAICGWLRCGRADPASLPPHLRYRVRRPQPQLN